VRSGMSFDGRKRVVIEGVEPEVDAGRFRAKRVVGDLVTVEADVFADGHDEIAAIVRYGFVEEETVSETSMVALGNDRWRARFPVTKLGRYWFTVEAWIDHFGTWQKNLRKRFQAGENLEVQLLMAAEMIERAAKGASAENAARLASYAELMRDRSRYSEAVERSLGGELGELMRSHPDRSLSTAYERRLEIQVEPVRARFSSWYELFPRSAGDGLRHGTLKDVERRLPYVADMGFDVLYLPPIHPIGESFRKGRNNSTTAHPDDVGSPWAIGSSLGGHTAIHPELGTIDDFRSLVSAAKERGVDIALDIAFQAAPDHPWVKEHPQWFLWRPDNTVQYAENPPKKYQDIYPFHFESPAWEGLWNELREVFLYWIGEGITVFRVDNPHTKPLPFWEWVIDQIKLRHPEVIFLSEAFTRPKVMYRLAKAGFSQSYTYFTWRNTKQELTTYFTELTRTRVRDYFRPNAWPNTPDILPEFLQSGVRAAFQLRLILAATLSSNYGIYGPAYELMVHEPRDFGGEEYRDSEKYELKQWNLEDPNSLRYVIQRVNRVRHENRALQSNDGLLFHSTTNDQLLCFSKSSEDGSNTVVVVANLDPYNAQSGFVELDLEKLGVIPDRPYQLHDLVTGARFTWHGARNFVQIDPNVVPAHLFLLRHRVRSEQDFEYYL
jgi:starch synthase (maltosyl-transferring)